MSLSRSIARLNISLGVAIQRTIGRILAGGKKNTNIKTKLLPMYFARKYLPVVNAPKNQKTSVEKPEKIWQFWDNAGNRKTPRIVNVCLETVAKNKGKFEQKILDMQTIDEYADLPGFIFDRLKAGQMHFPHFADLLRLNLLKNHGGVWMDATNYMTNEIPDYITDEDFFVFLVGQKTHFPYSFMQNFFIRAKKDSFLCKAWYDMCIEYWKHEVKDIDYFQHQLMFKALIEKHPLGRELFAKMPHVSEDETLQFVGDDQFQKFDKKEWERIKKHSFFQKLTYKDGRHTIANPADYPDSYFAKILEKK
jgi:hypothetical protein